MVVRVQGLALVEGVREPELVAAGAVLADLAEVRLAEQAVARGVAQVAGSVALWLIPEVCGTPERRPAAVVALVAAEVREGLVAEVSGAAVARVPEAAVVVLAVQEADLPGALDWGPLSVANQIPPGNG